MKVGGRVFGTGSTAGDRRIWPSPLLRMVRKHEGLNGPPPDREEVLAHIVGGSAAIARMKREIQAVAPLHNSVLITGEPGTGKGLVAMAIHLLSKRVDRPFVVVNCPAMPESLADAILFGHVRGAFATASRSHAGKLEEIHRGTLFLNGVSTLPLTTQAKLLHTLEHGEAERVGSNKPFPVNVRVIAATNADINEEVRIGRFRKDLFFRLSEYGIYAPSLKEHLEDILLLVGHFLDIFNSENTMGIQIGAGVLKCLERSEFPGNVRELFRLIMRAAALAAGDTTIISIPILKEAEEKLKISGLQGSKHESLIDNPEHVARLLIEKKYNLGKVTNALGISRSTLIRRLKIYLKKGVFDGTQARNEASLPVRFEDWRPEEIKEALQTEHAKLQKERIKGGLDSRIFHAALRFGIPVEELRARIESLGLRESLIQLLFRSKTPST